MLLFLCLVLASLCGICASLLDPPRSPECGTDAWRHTFADRQRATVAGIESVAAWIREQPPPLPEAACRLPGLADELRRRDIRLVMWRCRARGDCGGLGDRQRGIVSTLAYGLGAARGFFLDWPLSEQSWEGADGVPLRLSDELWALLGVLPLDELAERALLPVCHVTSFAIEHDYINGPPWRLVGTMPDDAAFPIVIVNSNVNCLKFMQLHWPPWQQWVAASGIPEQHVWGCLNRLVMQPTAFIVEHYRGFLARLQTPLATSTTVEDTGAVHPDAVLGHGLRFVGIHIRTGSSFVGVGLAHGWRVERWCLRS